MFLGALLALDQTQAFGVLRHSDAWMARFDDLGLAGIFLIAVVANSSLLIQVPYTLPLLTIALGGAGLTGMLPAALACGIGAGVGEVISYAIAERLLSRNPALADSRLFRWVTRSVERHPRLTPALVFTWSASILPDDTVVIPLAMMRYGLRKIFLPLFSGKILHCLVVALIFYSFTGWASAHVSSGIRTDLGLGLLIAFLMLILYQAEKAREAARRAQRRAPEMPSVQPPPPTASGAGI